MSSNGFRKQPSSGKKQQIAQMQVEMQNLQMAIRVSQMMMQQLVSQIQKMNQDMQNTAAIANNLDYRTLALMDQLSVNKDALEATADALKLKDYNEMSDKEDKEKNYAVVDTVEDDSIVIITSEAPENKGIFRSKFRLADAMQHLQDALKGKKTGDKVPALLNGATHLIEIVGVRKPPAEQKVEAVAADLEVDAHEHSEACTH